MTVDPRRWINMRAGMEGDYAKTQESCNISDEGEKKPQQKPTKIGLFYTASILHHPNVCLKQRNH